MTPTSYTKGDHMLYLSANSSVPIEYISSGNLYNEDQFRHPDRKLDSFVLIIVLKGILHITQGASAYMIHENEFLLLLPDTKHFGHQQSDGELSYYWTHFYVRDPDYRIYSLNSLLTNNTLYTLKTEYTSTLPIDSFLIPEYGRLSAEKRSIPLFSRLLDLSRRENYNATWRCHYALSSLLLEVSAESFDLETLKPKATPSRLLSVIEYIRINYDKPISVEYLAQKFNYCPTYLTRIFKQHTGYPLLIYINRTRISIAKTLLCIGDLPVVIIAKQCGFPNDKYFMRVFKKMEGLTPSQYRILHTQKKLNRR